jgi:hypothetical protein
VPVQRHRSVIHFVKRSMKTARLSRSCWKFFTVFISRKLAYHLLVSLTVTPGDSHRSLVHKRRQCQQQLQRQ